LEVSLTEAELREGIANLNAAIASGELKVSYAGRSTEYRSIDDLVKAKRELERELTVLATPSGARPSRIINVRVLS
jgi:hypothetical protein